MREFAKISPKIWINDQGRKIKKLGAETQLIALYLLTNPHANMIGIYYLPVALIVHETGISIEGALKGLESLSRADFCSYDHKSEYVWVHEMAFEQIGTDLKEKDNRVKGVYSALSLLPELPFIQDFNEKYLHAFHLNKTRDFEEEIEAPLKCVVSKENKKDKDNKKEKRAIVPRISYDDHPLKSHAIKVLNFLNMKTGKAFRPIGINVKLIIDCLNTGATIQQCKQVIALYVREWGEDKKMVKHLRPATLFNPDNFEQYIGELVIKEKEEKHEFKQ